MAVVAKDTITLARVDDGEQGTQGINLLLSSQKPNIALYGSAKATITYDIEVSEWGAKDAIRVQGTRGSSDLVFLLNNDPKSYSPIGKYTESVHVKNQGKSDIRIGRNTQRIVAPDESGRIYEVISNSSATNYLQMQFYTSDSEFDIIFWHPKIEVGEVKNTIWTPAPQDLVGPQGPQGEQGEQGEQGPAGAKGDTGAAGRTYILETSSTTIKMLGMQSSSETTKISPRTLTLSGYYRDGTSATKTAYACRFKVEGSIDGSTFTTIYTSSANESSVTFALNSKLEASSIPEVSGKTISIPENVTMLRCTMYADDVIDTTLDICTIAVLKDVGTLTHEQVFNLLTNNGAMKGIFSKDNQLYINATYIKSGTLTLGGSSNGNGTLVMLASDNHRMATFDNSGLLVTGSDTDALGYTFIKADKYYPQIRVGENYSKPDEGIYCKYYHHGLEPYLKGEWLGRFGEDIDEEDEAKRGLAIETLRYLAIFAPELKLGVWATNTKVSGATLDTTCVVPLTCLKGSSNSSSAPIGQLYFQNSGASYFGRLNCSSYIRLALCHGGTVDSYIDLATDRTKFNKSILFPGTDLGVRAYDTSNNDIWLVRSYSNTNSVLLGTSTIDTRLYGANIYMRGTSTAVTSDKNTKLDFKSLDKYEVFFGLLKPWAYRMVLGSSGRFHVGYAAQEVEEALIKSGLTTDEFAGVIKEKTDREYWDEVYGGIPKGMEEYEYSLRYEEFIALNTHMIQKAMDRLDKLEAKLRLYEGVA